MRDGPGEKKAMGIIGEISYLLIEADLFLQHPAVGHTLNLKRKPPRGDAPPWGLKPKKTDKELLPGHSG